MAMAGIDGAETYRRVLELRPSQRAIVVSGSPDSAEAALARALGVGTVESKPLSRERLARVVREALDKHSRSRKAELVKG